MPREIERKFLPKSDAWRSQVARSRPMSQGYLASAGDLDSAQERFDADLRKTLQTP